MMPGVYTAWALWITGFALAPAHRALAESRVATGTTGALSVSANLDFALTIPRILYLRVGTGTEFVANNTVDLVDFTVPAAAMGNGTAVAGTGGDLGNGAVTVRVQGNGGNIILNVTNSGPLRTAAPIRTIGWDQIVVTPTALAATTPGFTNGVLPHPNFNLGAGGGAGTAVTLMAANGLVRREGRWTYRYANANVPPAGVYGGVNTNNSRVTYTATLP